MPKTKEAFIIDRKALEAEMGKDRLRDFVARSEQYFQSQVAEIAERALQHTDLRTILISGPTSSGKTTFSTHFVERIQAAGRPSHLISLDDYYFEGAVRYDEEGRPDFESVDTLELSLLKQHLQALSRGEEVSLPRFDFKRRERTFPASGRLRLGEQDLLIVEGLHALSKEVLGQLDRRSVLAIFIRPMMYYMDDSCLLRPDDFRMLRRISRDVFHRGSSALETLDFWPMIQRAEADFIDVYWEVADVVINSALPYELMLVPPSARYQIERAMAALMAGELPDSRTVRPGRSYANLNRAIQGAHRLLKATDNLPQISLEWIPEDSILREFV